MKLENPIISELAKDNRTYFESTLNCGNPLYIEVCQDLHIISDIQLFQIIFNEF